MPRTITAPDPVKVLTKELRSAQEEILENQREIREYQAEIQARLSTLESQRPGRKPKPILAYKERDVCGIDPERDSETCPDASIYRYQSGCWGAKCRYKQHMAYERRKPDSEPETPVSKQAKVAVRAKNNKTIAKTTAAKPAAKATKAAKPPRQLPVKSVKAAKPVSTPSKRIMKKVARAS